MQLILVIGVSGAGKNVALGALEDMGFSIVNNLPCALLLDTVDALVKTQAERFAISVDARAADFVATFNAAHAQLAQRFSDLQVIRLDASDTTLMRRFAETRRKHPFVNDQNTLQDAIREERERLTQVQATVTTIDTSATSSHMLRQRVRNLANAGRANASAATQPLLEISSFAYRQGIPPDADLVFDARILPNPHYEPGLAAQTGRDPAVIAYLQAQPETAALVQAIANYVRHALPGFQADNRARVHIAIGCTGGKHRSVYVANALQNALANEARVLRHDREHPVAD